MAIGRIGSRDSATVIETYRFIATAGQTSLSGADAGGNTLNYPLNYEVVFLNGVRLVRGDDYQATTGNSITGLTALAANDVVEIQVFQAVDVADALTQSSAAATYAPLASPALTGTPTAPTASADTNTTQVATTAFVLGQASSTNPAMNGSVAVGTSTRYARADHVHASDTSRAPLASPALTGTPTAPTAAADTNTTQLATTAFVLGQAASTTPAALGTAAVGTSTRYARADHVHATPTLESVNVPTVTRNAQTANYTLVLADAGKLVEMGVASANTLTIPADASVNFPVGTKIDVLQTGAGQTTIAGSGFTPNATPGLKISAQWGAATLIKRAANTWVVIGNLSA